MAETKRYIFRGQVREITIADDDETPEPPWQPVVCPICRGDGNESRTCRACDGTGVLWR